MPFALFSTFRTLPVLVTLEYGNELIHISTPESFQVRYIPLSLASSAQSCIIVTETDNSRFCLVRPSETLSDSTSRRSRRTTSSRLRRFYLKRGVSLRDG